MKTLVCLHGWGGSNESFTELREALKGLGYQVLAPDLPGFGKEPEPPTPWTVGDYANWVQSYIEQNVNGPYAIVAHSHGGRITLKLLSHGSLKQAPEHVFLCASAGIRRRRHFKRVIGLTLAKGGKFILSLPVLKQLQPLGKKLLYKLVRVHDYEKASSIMQQTLILVSREDLRPLLPSIFVTTDIFWGTDDGMTPYADGKIMEKEIPNARLHSFPGVRHRVHRDKAPEIATVISNTF